MGSLVFFSRNASGDILGVKLRKFVLGKPDNDLVARFKTHVLDRKIADLLGGRNN